MTSPIASSSGTYIVQTSSALQSPNKTSPISNHSSSIQTAKASPSPKNVEHLEISLGNKLVIKNLLEEVATHSVIHLIYNALRLKEIGRQLKEEVHPFRFLLEIYSDPLSKKHFEKIHEERESIFSGRNQIWNDFSANLAKNFNDRIHDIEHYVESFARELSLDLSTIQELQKEGNWKELLLFIAQVKR